MTMYDIKIIEKWKPILDYQNDNIPVVSSKLRLGCAQAMEDAESIILKFRDGAHLAKLIIPMIRRLYPFYIMERGYYSPTKGQDFHGESFEAFKIFNLNHEQSKYQAIPLDKKYFEDDIKSMGQPLVDIARYPFDF